MEYGVVTITNGAGFIQTSQSPSPVNFKPLAFHDIHSGDKVAFLRSVSGDWATYVGRADAVNALVLSATPAGGLTLGARSLLFRKATKLVHEAGGAPSLAQTKAHIEYGHKIMRSIAQRAGTGTARLGVRAVNAYLK